MKTDPMDNSSLKLDALSVGYNGIPLISDITLSLKRGEILTLIGPNGAGKSTILKSITRHLALLSGTVFLDGKNLRLYSRREAAEKMAVVLTECVCPDLTTCFEFVSAGRYPYTGGFGLLTARDRAVVKDALAKVRALDLADRQIARISDGQRQRILLARALCQEPEVIVLDEPTSFLDIRHKIELLGILADMAKSGITVVLSLHEIDLAERISDKIVCVKDGGIAACGRPAEVFSDEKIKELYGIDRGSFGALYGNIELAAPQGDIRVFVLGGGGYGVKFYRALQKRGIAFAAGILPGNDLDLPVCLPLAKRAVCAKPFEDAAPDDIAAAKALIDAVDTVIDAGCPCGKLNACQDDLRRYAAAKGKRVIASLEELDLVFGGKK